MNRLEDRTLDHLRTVLAAPDLDHPRYRILEPLGQGGMGIVFLAEDRELGREVALKVLHRSDTSDDALARLRRESRVLAALEHPGIVPVHDIGTLADGRAFVVMKRVHGHRLDDYAAENPSRADRLRVFVRICEAVAFAHARGVIHRDLKPSNVMVGEYGEVLTLDWGAARKISERAGAHDETVRHQNVGVHATPLEIETLTSDGTVIGTPGWMAPEQAAAGDVTDERSDVFALGGVLRFLITGQGPVASVEPSPRDADGAERHKLPRALEAIIHKAMAASPADRYPAVTELAADVLNHLDARPIRAYRETPFERGARFTARYRVAILLVLAYVAMRLLLIAFDPT